MKILVTGASGYIGSRLVKLAAKNEHNVIAASRNRFIGASNWMHFDILEYDNFQIPLDIDAVIHLAAILDSPEYESRQISAAINLLSQSKSIGAKFIFISSQTARSDAPTAYGRSKWQIEREVLKADGCVIRPGQVYGGLERGLFGTLVRLVRLLPLVPDFFPSPKIQPVHIDDLCTGILSCVEFRSMTSCVLHVASPELVSFTTFLQSIGRYRVRRLTVRVPIPTAFIYIGSHLIGEKLRIKTGMGRLISLFELPPITTENDMRVLGISLRTLASGMAPSGNNRRRELSLEGFALLLYILRSKPSPSLVRRYTRVVESLGNGEGLGIPFFFLANPLTIALIDDSKISAFLGLNNLNWRLNIATLIAEASPQGYLRFIAVSKSPGFWSASFKILYSVASEVSWRIIRYFFTQLLCLFGKKLYPNEH